MPESAIKFGSYEASITRQLYKHCLNVCRLRNAFSPRSKDTMTLTSYIHGRSSLLAELRVSQPLLLPKPISLTRPGMVSQFAVYPIDTLKL
jgi:hypothetical protein